jgi:hypothetical protein
LIATVSVGCCRDKGDTMNGVPDIRSETGIEGHDDKLRIFECNDEFEILDLSCSFDSASSADLTEPSTYESMESRREKERAIFQKIREYLSPGWLFRSIIYFYTQRKLIVFFWIHFVSTMVIWGKYFDYYRHDHDWKFYTN